ncbi:MAG: hypothetical protein CMG66_03430 [Candidatus Marinimicrobia bacterium]|nr:hypothetical protein [Candidatus Neomarinimicrobiota bacterium]|tara:strand:- start:8051 stop:10348 length:2298 start_codon:yes stop_codon:yes gene_type:complete
MKKIKENYQIFIIGFLSIVVALLLHNMGLYSLIETKLYDYRFQLRGPNVLTNPDVVLVEIDDESYRLINEPYPYTRKLWANVVENLTKAGAKVIAFDIQFDSEINKPNYRVADLEFLKSLKFANENGTKVILASKLGYERSRLKPYYIVNPISLFKKESYTGVVDHEVDEIDNFSRRYTIFNLLPDDSTKYLSFGLKTAMCFLDINSDYELIQDVENNKIIIDKLIIRPYRSEASFLLNYYGPTSNIYSTFPVYSLSNIIDDNSYQLKNINEDQDWIEMFINDKHPLYERFGFDNSPFKNKVVVIGSSLKEDHDFVQTPFFNYNNNENPIPGLEFHANAIQQIIDNNYIITPTKTLDLNSESFIYHIIIIVFIVSLVLLLSYNLGLLQSIFSILILSLIWFSISIGLFINDQLWLIKNLFNLSLNPFERSYLIPVFYPIATIIITYTISLLYNLFTERRDKYFLKETFGRYISSDLIDEMYKTKKIPELGGESGIRTAFFSDIESFTTIAEKLSASELVNLLNELLSEQTEILINNHGTLDKYEGDAILGFFGAPVFYEKHATHAIDTGVEMQMNLCKIREKWKNENKYSLDEIINMKMRIGVNSGEMVTGNMGSSLHMNYTMMGEEVNLASRLESGARLYGIYFHTTYDTLQKAGLDRYQWRYIDRIVFKGLKKYKQTVEVFGYKENNNNNNSKLIKLFHQGLEYYYNKDWDSAIRFFTNCLKYEIVEHSVDLNPSIVFLERCKKYKIKNPASSWNGIVKLNKK